MTSLTPKNKKRRRNRAVESDAPEQAGEGAAPSKWRENFMSLANAVILFLIVRTFVLQAFRIPSESMEDTLLEGDFLFVNKFLYGAKVPFTDDRLPGLRDIRAGDVVVFKSPVDGKDWIKRCVAVGGDTISVRDNVVYVNGDATDEPYLKLEGPRAPVPRAASWPLDADSYVVPEEHFFAMGDNRWRSSDSRFFSERKPGLEPAVPTDRVVGKALFIYASLDPERYYLPRFSRMFRPIR